VGGGQAEGTKRKAALHLKRKIVYMQVRRVKLQVEEEEKEKQSLCYKRLKRILTRTKLAVHPPKKVQETKKGGGKRKKGSAAGGGIQGPKKRENEKNRQKNTKKANEASAREQKALASTNRNNY